MKMASMCAFFSPIDGQKYAAEPFHRLRMRPRKRVIFGNKRPAWDQQGSHLFEWEIRLSI